MAVDEDLPEVRGVAFHALLLQRLLQAVGVQPAVGHQQLAQPAVVELAAVAAAQVVDQLFLVANDGQHPDRPPRGNFRHGDRRAPDGKRGERAAQGRVSAAAGHTQGAPPVAMIGT